MLIWDSPKVVNQWVAENNGGFAPPDHCTALGWADSNGRLVGGLVFHQTNGVHCLVNIALSDKVFPAGLLKAGLRYVFTQLKLRRLTFIISDGNIRSINLVSALGATHEATLRDADITGNLLIFALFPDTCPIWRKLNGQECRSAAIPESGGNDPAANSS